METGVATTENSIEVPQETKNITTIVWSNNSTSYVSEKNEHNSKR